MLKKSLVVLSISVAYFMQAQDVSTITNSLDVYSNTTNFGTAKYNAMAGSTGALGGDGNALLNNPAGLGVAISGNISGTLSIQSYKNASTLNNSLINYRNSNVDIGNVSGIASFQLLTETAWKFVNLGMNYSSQSLDNYVESPKNTNIVVQKALVDVDNNPVTGNLSFNGHAYDRTGNLSKMSFGVGANYDNRIFLGAGLNFHGSTLQQLDVASFNLDLDHSVVNYYKQYTPFSEQGSGFSANIGIIGKISKQLRLGAAIETPTWWTIDRTYEENYIDSNGLVYYNAYDESRSFSSPFLTTLSASLVPNKYFSFNVDYTIGLSRPKYRVQGPAEIELNDFFKDNSKITSELKLGGEYRYKGLRVRGGFNHANSPFDSLSFSAYNNAGQLGIANSSNVFISSRNLVAFGLGYDFRSFYIDGSYQNISSKYYNPFLGGDATLGTGYYSGDFDVNTPGYAVSEVKKTKNNFFITLGWKF